MYAAPGTYTVRVDLVDEDGTFTNRGTATTLNVTAIPVVLPAPPLTVAGVGGDVIVYNADGSVRFGMRPYEGYVGNVVVAVGDVTGDGIDDIVTGTETQSSHVKVFDGVTGASSRASSPTGVSPVGSQSPLATSSARGTPK